MHSFRENSLSSLLWLAILLLWVSLVRHQSSAHKSLRRRLLNGTITAEEDGDNDTPFTIIFLSDLETKYRGHDIRRSQYIVDYVKHLHKERLTFDEPYQQHAIDPQLVLHGGDMGHMWSCDNFEWFLLGGCRNPQDDYKDVWNRLYKAGIPLLSAFGNHDWRARNGTGNPWGSEADQPPDEETHCINRWSNEFTRLSYEKSAQLTQLLQYQEIPPTGQIGQSMYRATFRGVQIVNFNLAFNGQSYDPGDDGRIYSADDQFERLSNTLDRNMKTIFFSHYPLNKGGSIGEQSPSLSTATALIREFGDGVAHFSGHYHVNRVYAYKAAEPNFNDYVVPYPHVWNGDEPGLLAILVSPKEGVLQVKTLTIPGLEDGEICMPLNYLHLRSYFFGFWPEKCDQANAEASSSTTTANPDINPRGIRSTISDATRCCSTCKAGKESWSPAKRWFVCGDVEEGGAASAREFEKDDILEVPDETTFREENLS